MIGPAAELSSGFLPLSPLLHGNPTAVGVLDLEAAPGISSAALNVAHAHDHIVLVRLHGQPLGIVALSADAASLPPGELTARAWAACADEIVKHVKACNCMPLPASADGLLSGLVASEGTCSTRVPPRPPGRAAVIVCTVGRADLLERCISSIVRSACADFEVVIVDNRPSTSQVRDLVEGHDAPVAVRYVMEPRPGLAIARNTGIAAADGAQYVAFTDDDVLVDELWLAWLLAPFTERSVDAVTGLVMPLSLESPVQKRFERYCGFGKGTVRQLYDLREHRADDRLLYPYWGGMFGSGNSMAFRRSALTDVGCFDPALGAGTPAGAGEDTAAFTEIVLRGGAIVYEPRSVCWHEHRSDEASLERQIHSYGLGLTAVFWRFLWRDTQFVRAAVRSIPVIARLFRSRRDERSIDALPGDLSRVELRGRIIGPWRYMQSVRRLRRPGAPAR